jgi:hypothetical protein
MHSSNTQWWDRVAILNKSETAQPLGLTWNRKCRICGVTVRH